MNLTPEQIAREREAFEKWFREHYDIPLIRNSRAEAAWIARAEIAAAEREQRDKALQHVIDEIAGQLRVGALKDEPFNGKIYWRQIIGVCQQALGLDAVLAAHEKGATK